jgi:hypothetical protein
VQPRDLHLLQIFEHLPPSAVVPIPVVAAVDGTSEKTVRRKYDLVQVSDRRFGVLKGNILKSRERAA